MFETEYFDQVAEQYDYLYLDHISQAENQVVAELININCERCNSVLDLGCGTGLMLELAQVHFPNLGRFVGLDISPGMLDIFRQKSELLEDKFREPVDLELHCADINSFDQYLDPLEKFDVCLSTFGSFSYIHDLPEAIQKIQSRLTPNGLALLMFYSKKAIPSPDKFTKSNQERIVSSYSFRNDSLDLGSPAYFYSRQNLEEAVKNAGVKKYKIFGLNHKANKEYQGFSEAKVWSTLNKDMHSKDPNEAHSLILTFGYNPSFHVK